MSFFFGAGMGLLFGGPLGAVVGGALEHYMTKDKQQRITTDPSSKPNSEAVFVTNLAAIATKICLADGHISPEERSILHSFFSHNLHFQGEELRFIDGIIEETRSLNPDLREMCYAFKQMTEYNQRLLLLDLAYQIALADQVITKEEQVELDRITEYLGIRQEEAERIHRTHTGASKSDHRATLGVSPNASVDEIKRAYKQLATQYHPDKVSHLGEELIAFAGEKFREINEAYNAIRKQKGF